MITDLISNFLNYSPEQAKAFLQLFSEEKQWKTQHYKEEFNPKNIKTKADLFKFIQAVGQSQWFKGHDRSCYEDDIIKDLKKDEYFRFNKVRKIDLSRTRPQMFFFTKAKHGSVKLFFSTYKYVLFSMLQMRWLLTNF